MNYILYNSLANNKIEPKIIRDFKDKEPGKNKIVEVIGLDYVNFFESLGQNDVVTLVGGDGTISYLINSIGDYKIKNNLYYVPYGHGNDMFRDVAPSKDTKSIFLNDYINNLPTLEVNGEKKKVINGVGFGIDGYCCEEADRIKLASDKKINYTKIAIKGILSKFKPVNATVIVDGTEYKYEYVWLAATMYGRYYGGGMMIAPSQYRDEDGKLSLVIYRAKSKLKALLVFPSIFKGEHINKEDVVTVYRGREIEVIFDRPTALQYDGETVTNVTSYRMYTK